MKKLGSIFALLLTMFYSLYAIEVNQEELKSQSTDTESIQFDNYSGPHAVIETAAAITGIGTNIGLEVAKEIDVSKTVFPGAKYSLIHAVDTETEGKLDADILLINETATVDHIKNLRRIITGYLTAAYSYEVQDAETLAVFITVYNAVYRNQLSAFTEKYKETVLENLTEEKVGLSTIWSDWAGNTQIVIPLGELTELTATVDTTTITDPQVIEALRQEEDKSIEIRENMVSMKEKEVEDATVKAQEAQKEAAEQKTIAATTEDPEEASIAKEKAQEAAKEATEQQMQADKKRTEVQTEVKEIEKDKGIATEVVDKSNYVTGLFISDEKAGLHNLVTVDGVSGNVILKSPVTQIRNKNVYSVTGITVEKDDGAKETFATMYIAVCGVSNNHSAVKLCLIDSDKLEVQKESKETLADTSDLLQQGDSYYAVIKDTDGKYYIGQYDKNLSLINKSSDSVKATTPINVTAKGILVTSANGNPCMLNLSNLSTVW